MWLCVDRMEGNTVVLLDDDAAVIPLSRTEYTALTGCEPRESDVLTAEVDRDGHVVSATYDEAETKRRRDTARRRLDRLFGRSKSDL